MMNPKRQIQRLLERLPNDSSLEDVQYHLQVMLMLRSRSQIADEGRFISQQDAELRMARWTRKAS